MTQERLQEIRQLLEAWRETDNRYSDSEKTSVVAELLDEGAKTADCFTSSATGNENTLQSI
jgi:hypothetical protein